MNKFTGFAEVYDRALSVTRDQFVRLKTEQSRNRRVTCNETPHGGNHSARLSRRKQSPVLLIRLAYPHITIYSF